MENFYPDLEKAVEAAEKELKEVKIEDEVTDVVCEECLSLIHILSKYNGTIRLFPVNVAAGLLHFHKKAYLEIG